MINIFVAKVPQAFDIQGSAESFKNSFVCAENLGYLQNILKKSSDTAKTQSLFALILLANGLSCLQISTKELILSKSPTGKPFLENAEDLHFSISHDESYAAVAISVHPVGIDIQSEIKNPKKIAKRFFSPLEYKKMNDGDESFLALWTKKEALCKLKDTSLISIASTPLPNNVFFHTETINSHVLSVAAEHPHKIKIHFLENFS